MNSMSHIKRLCICAICIALCCILPTAFHAMGVGSNLSPLHIPVLLCGLICGGGCGAFCGIAGSLLCSLLTGMPPMAKLAYMMPELCAYGLFAGLLMHFIRTRHLSVDLYLSLLGTMVLGRVVGGLARILTLRILGSSEVFTVQMWVASYVVGSLPGIIAHLILIPALILVLEKANLLPKRYPRQAQTNG